MSDPLLPSKRSHPVVTVNRCVCHDVPFETIKEWADTRTQTTLEDIEIEWCCGSSCGMCRQYLLHMLATGETTIPMIMPTDEH
ncbi:MAG: hypothetical protein MK077_07635 [Phycisphaerales bacterium]|nr:hypothetical protein [Phycisphaerales bacterium]